MGEVGMDAVPALPQLPTGAAFNLAFCQRLAAVLDTATRQAPALLPLTALPQAACLALLKRAEKLLRGEPTLVHVRPPAGAEVVVVGDLHGQFHDLLAIFGTVGFPSASRLYVFNGDFVDRGAWGLETLLLLCALKVAAPASVALVRGNHESLYCSWVYGFRAEVLAKYGAAEEKEGETVFSICRALFSHLPLAAVVAGTTLVVHGGLPRAPVRRVTRRSAPADRHPVTVASLSDIAASSKGGEDPEPERSDQRLAADVLWSDPASQPGVQLGARPGDVGILFGPDVTEAFLRDNELRLILRGHEGPDARTMRPDMQPMLEGYTLDHDTPSGKLYTVFSAPQYPQFGQPQHQNLGAVAMLSAPSYSEPRFVQFAAAPRPEASPFVASEAPECQAEDEEAAAASREPGAADGTEGGASGESGGSSESEGSSSGESSSSSSEEEDAEEDEEGSEKAERSAGLHLEAGRGGELGGTPALVGSRDLSSSTSQAAEESSLGVPAGPRDGSSDKLAAVGIGSSGSDAAAGEPAGGALPALAATAAEPTTAAGGPACSQDPCPAAKRQRFEGSLVHCTGR